MGHLCPSAQCAASHGQAAFRAEYGMGGFGVFDPPMWWNETRTLVPRVGIARKPLDHKAPTFRRRVSP